ncbi:MAG: glycosyltransferase family 2 protein [Candidatus Competibacteraceae bacterium]|nr:glycosyltransferase family 2 protein [Candidatus Competibacteraceae bacterium]
MQAEQPINWQPGSAPVAVIMIALNEGHNMEAVLQNLRGWAQEVFLVDSYSADDTVDIALKYGVYVVQRRFRGFGDQWNFALENLPITAPWTMKLDPDERLTDELKQSIIDKIEEGNVTGISFNRRLWFMRKPLPVKQEIVRIWKTGKCRFTDVLVNEHPIVDGIVERVDGDLEHHDSPDLEHWIEKQNRYTTAEAVIAYNQSELADKPFLLGTALQQRMWLKKHFYRVPGRYLALFFYHWIWQGAWRAGWVGFVWSRLRVMVIRLIEYKLREIQLTDRIPIAGPSGPGQPDSRVQQY